MKLHSNDATALVDLWTGVKTYVPAKDQHNCAEQFIANIDDTGLVDLSTENQELYGVCDVFDKALRIYVEENVLDDQPEDLEDWDE